MAQGTITENDRTFVETWENIAPFANTIIRLDSRGIEKPELITGRRNFMVTTEERMITQDRIITADLDPFLNGSFRPVLVPDSVNIKSNPNALSDDEIRSILASSQVAFDEWMKVIDSPETLRRMITLAEDTDVSLKRYKTLAGRLQDVRPARQVTQKDRAEYEKMAGAPEAAAPAAEPRAQRRRGGMSADYR